MATIDEARAAKEKVTRLLEGRPGLRGIGLSRFNGGYALKVNIADRAYAPDVPDDVDGVPVKVEVVGEIRPRSGPAGSRT